MTIISIMDHSITMREGPSTTTSRSTSMRAIITFTMMVELEDLVTTCVKTQHIMVL